MRELLLVVGAVFGLLAGPGALGAGDAAKDGQGRLDLRASPRMAFPPASVLLTAEIKGEPGEELYCPGLEWDWGDGSRSSEESDCPPFRDGVEPERYFRARHVYRAPGSYDVKITLKRAERTLAMARIEVVVIGVGQTGMYDR